VVQFHSPESMKCSICHKEIKYKIYYVDVQPVCKKCYYEGLGKLAETHPIGFGNFDKTTD